MTARLLLVIGVVSWGCAADRVTFGGQTVTGDLASPVAVAKTFLRKSRTLGQALGTAPPFEGVTVIYRTDPYRCTVSSTLRPDGPPGRVEVDLVPLSTAPAPHGETRRWQVRRAVLYLDGREIPLQSPHGEPPPQ